VCSRAKSQRLWSKAQTEWTNVVNGIRVFSLGEIGSMLN
jgi:hypothetical protein